jgi:hypothetical protein
MTTFLDRWHQLAVDQPLLRTFTIIVRVLVAVMWTHPQVYVDVGAISFALPRAAFHEYLRRIVEAGFGRRVMFGSDQMIWPEALEAAIQSIEQAAFLTADQKRDIFYNNAARFLKLTQKEIAAHHGR